MEGCKGKCVDKPGTTHTEQSEPKNLQWILLLKLLVGNFVNGQFHFLIQVDEMDKLSAKLKCLGGEREANMEN